MEDRALVRNRIEDHEQNSKRPRGFVRLVSPQPVDACGDAQGPHACSLWISRNLPP